MLNDHIPNSCPRKSSIKWSSISPSDYPVVSWSVWLGGPLETRSHTSLVDPCALFQGYIGILGQVNWNLLWHQSWKTSKGLVVSLPLPCHQDQKNLAAWPNFSENTSKISLECPTCHFIKGIFKPEGALFLRTLTRRWYGLAHGNQLTGSPSTSWCPEGISESRSNSSRNSAVWNPLNQKTGLHCNL